MTGGTIFGRSPNAALALTVAVFNALVVFQVGGFSPTAEQIAAANTFFAVLIAFIANVPELAVQAGAAAINRLNAANPTVNKGTQLANNYLENGSKISHIVAYAYDDPNKPSNG